MPIVINTYAGVLNADGELVEMARAAGATRPQIFRRILLPGALPFIVVGLRLGATIGLINTVVAELYTAVPGLGGLLAIYGNTFQMAPYFVVIFILAPSAPSPSPPPDRGPHRTLALRRQRLSAPEERRPARTGRACTPAGDGRDARACTRPSIRHGSESRQTPDLRKARLRAIGGHSASTFQRLSASEVTETAPASRTR